MVTMASPPSGPVLVDSDVIIDALAQRTAAIQVLARFHPRGFALSVITVAEILDGTYQSATPFLAATEARELYSTWTLLDVSAEVADRFARLRGGLRRQGSLIPDMDLLIAATAVHYGLPLLTNNRRHFARIPGLVLVEAEQ